MGKGKGKKGKRGGKPNRSAGGATSTAAIADRPAATAATAVNPFSAMPCSQAMSAPPAESEAATSWMLWLRNLGIKVGVYALFLFGVYWLAAAYFAWYGELHWLVGPVWMAIFGLICIALGWYLLGPELPTSGGEPAKQLSPAERRKEAFEHMWRGVWWLIGGLAVTLVSYNLAILGGGGKYVVTTGIMLYGVSQIIRGAVQVYGPQRN